MEIPKKCELPFADIVLKDTDWSLVSSKLINIIGDEEVVLSDPSSFMML